MTARAPKRGARFRNLSLDGAAARQPRGGVSGGYGDVGVARVARSRATRIGQMVSACRAVADAGRGGDRGASRTRWRGVFGDKRAAMWRRDRRWIAEEPRTCEPDSRRLRRRSATRRGQRHADERALQARGTRACVESRKAQEKLAPVGDLLVCAIAA